MATAIFWLFLTLNAFAYPDLGDRAELVGDTLTRNGEESPLEITTELLAYDQSSQRWEVGIFELRNGRKKARVEMQSALFTPRLYQEMIEKCRERGGRRETITVAAGAFEVCHLLTAVTLDLTEETWYGNVPFGVVKKIETNYTEGRKDSVELKSFRSKAQH
jgi:hypothetical protein